jgi:thioredoxin 1
MNNARLTLILFIVFSFLSLTVSGSSMRTPIDRLNPTGSKVLSEFPDTPFVVTDRTLGTALDKYSSLVLDCWEEGCRPCQLIDAKINGLAMDLKGQAVFGKLNVNQNRKTAAKYQIFNYPTILIFNYGSLVYRHIGNIPKDELENLILRKLGIK